MAVTFVPQEALDSGLLNPSYHERLLADAHQIVELAGVPLRALWAPLSKYCTQEEVSWVRVLRRPTDLGLVLLGKGHDVSVEDKMMAITGACLRNYTDARLMPLQEVMRLCKAGEMPAPTVLLIPNFCLDKLDGGDIASWDTQHLLGMLLHRGARGLKTILGISSWAAMEKQYGSSFRSHVETKYTVSTGAALVAA